MANVVSDRTLDYGLLDTKNLATHVHILSQDPIVYADVATYTLGNKNWGAGNALTGPAAGSPNGRQIQSVAITDGSVTATGTATKWAIIDSVNSRLLLNGSLAAGQAVTSGNTFTLASFTVRLPNQ